MQPNVQAEPKIVVIGGGTGSFTLLKALKTVTPHLTAIVNMTDDGGSTGVLRNELGVLPPGDARQCLVALSNAPQVVQDLFSFRFTAGGLMGHSFGNILLSATEKMTGDFAQAIQVASDLLQITGRVLPVTVTNSRLVLDLNGEKIVGEHIIETMFLPAGTKPALSLEPAAVLTETARQAIADADIIVIAPGNLYVSLIPALMTTGMNEALAATSAPLLYVCNLVNKPQQTADYSVQDYASELERFIGPAQLDYVLYNLDPPDETQLAAYALEGDRPVVVDTAALEQASYKAIGGHFLSTEDAGDIVGIPIKHSLIRHDSQAIAEAIVAICKSK